MDDNSETAGCIAYRRGLPKSIYSRFVNAGARAEIFLQRITADSDEECEQDGALESGDTAKDQQAYLSADLEYTEHNLVTKELNDGVMMDWEAPIMNRTAKIMCSVETEDNERPIVLNVGFGMGIIDTYIQELQPKKHYICEAHPAVLGKMKQDGWYDKPNVIILEGRWQDTVADLIGTVTIDAMYYDTFSEHYQDLVDFFDCVVALLSSKGIFSYFNGLGADRQVCYDVYQEVIEVDLNNYGLQVEFEKMDIDGSKDDGNSKVWEGIRHKYWRLREYMLPICRFMDM